MACASSPQMHEGYQEECEAAINQQVNLELHVSYTYLAMAHHFARKDVPLKNFADYFMQQSHKQRQHVETLMQLQNQRGAQHQPEPAGPALDGRKQGDMQLGDFLNSRFLIPQTAAIQQLDAHLANLRKLSEQTNHLAEDVLNDRNPKDSNKESCPTDTR
ncbi:ferritin heavy chain-like [Echinops telfairi]|uniref:Ferritin heavy chain-like n=1 Tax=Echinops telfairi TaxID=9371 RepID=A0AC55D3U8_ECHTE|nr:ferritin heavy chain-like [Echinops telfairi]